MCQLGQLWHGAARRRTRRGGLATKGEPCQRYCEIRENGQVHARRLRQVGDGSFQKPFGMGFVSHLSCFTSKCSKIPRQRQFTHVTFAALVWTEQKSLSSTWSILRKQEDPARRLLLRAS